MNVKFNSKIDDYEIEFNTEASINDGIIDFKDESLENTRIQLEIYPDDSAVRFKRYGDTCMDITFIDQTVSQGYFRNKMGLEFNFEANTNLVEIHEKSISLIYELYVNGEINNKTIITISFN